MADRISLAQAEDLAVRLCDEMRPFCERIEIAGSIRRRQQEVKDVEIVAVPRWEQVPDRHDLFGALVPENQLWKWACGSQVLWIKPGTSEIEPWMIKQDGKYWRGLLNDDQIKLDLFLATPDNFGLIYLIRTGSAEFSQAVVTHALRVGMRSEGGQLRRDDEVIPTPAETDVFRSLGLVYVPPSERSGTQAVRRA